MDHKSHASNIAGFYLLQISDFTATMEAVNYFNKACSQNGHLLVLETLYNLILFILELKDSTACALFFLLNAAVSFTTSSTGKT